ncbi:MAG: hypothetical protein JXA66_01575 [Oligoflexia bacterium]|nr:hypothetical protein [Oligoflexia bacterium]
MKNIFAIANDRGSRPVNENAYYCNQNTGLFVLSDGMGGALYGDEASNLVVKAVSDFMEHAGADSDATMLIERKRGVSTEGQYLLNAVNFANTELIKLARAASRYPEMGASIAAIYVSKRFVSLVNAGAVSVFLYRDSRIKRLSVDYSLGSYLMTDSPRPEQHIPLMFLGYTEPLGVVARDERIRSGDLVIILTSSVEKYLTVERIAKIISLNIAESSRQELDKAARDIIAQSRLSGNRDNATTIIIRNTG